jgi:hypothetical protein
MDGEGQAEGRAKRRRGTGEPVAYVRRDGCRLFWERDRYGDQRHIQPRTSGSPQGEELFGAGPDRVANRTGGADRRERLVIADRSARMAVSTSRHDVAASWANWQRKGCGRGGGVDRALVLQDCLANLLPSPLHLGRVRRPEAQHDVADDISGRVRRTQSGPVDGFDRRNECRSGHAEILAESHRRVQEVLAVDAKGTVRSRSFEMTGLGFDLAFACTRSGGGERSTGSYGAPDQPGRARPDS